jgi:putative membrane protein
MWMNYGHMGWGTGTGSMLGLSDTTLWWLVLIVGGVLFVKWIFGSTAWRRGRSGALDILAERYARGEIDREEYQNRKRELGA